MFWSKKKVLHLDLTSIEKIHQALHSTAALSRQVLLASLSLLSTKVKKNLVLSRWWKGPGEEGLLSFFYSFQQKKNTFLFTKRKLNFEALFAHWTRIQMYHLAFFVKQYALYAMYISPRQTLMFDVSISFFFSSKKKFVWLSIWHTN